MDPLTVAGIAILAFVLVVAVTAMNLKAASSFQKEVSGSSVSSQDDAHVRSDGSENQYDEEDVNKDENKTGAEAGN